MSCLRPEKKPSNPNNKPWKRLISTLQKKLNYFKKPKPFNRTTQSSHIPCFQHHHYHHRAKGVGYENDDNENGEVGLSIKKSSTVALQLNGVDASAEAFIENMKARWMLERQMSDKNYMQQILAKSLYDY